MDDQQRAIWNAILLGDRTVDSLEVELLLAGADDDDVRWVVRSFDPGADDLLARWQAHSAANLATSKATDDELIEIAVQWAAEVARSAATFGLDDLVSQCAMPAIVGKRPTRSGQLDYLDWISQVNATIDSAPDQQVGASQLREAYWGATNFHELVWVLAAPISNLPVDPTPCIEHLRGGGVCWITVAGPVIERFR